MMKMYRAMILDALARALASIYWYKNDLRSFLLRAGIPPAIVARYGWGDQREYKIKIANKLIDDLAQHPASGKRYLDGLIGEVLDLDLDFNHLEHLEDSARKIQDARQAVQHLKELLDTETVKERAERARQERRTKTERRRAEKKERKKVLRHLRKDFERLSKMSNEPIERGIEFEEFLRRLFAVHDLEPNGSFCTDTDQIDGSIKLDGKVVLVEARWRKKPSGAPQVRDFRGKVDDRLHTTLGIFIAMNGFTKAAVDVAGGGGSRIVLMDGNDLAPVLQGLHDLVEMLQRKFRHASERGEAMFRVG